MPEHSLRFPFDDDIVIITSVGIAICSKEFGAIAIAVAAERVAVRDAAAMTGTAPTLGRRPA